MPSAIPIPPKDSTIVVTDNTSNDVSTAHHGWAPKAPNDATKFLRGDATWAVPAGGMADPMTTAGDIVARNSGNTTDRVARGEKGALLSGLGAGIPGWKRPTDIVWLPWDFIGSANGNSIGRGGLLNNSGAGSYAGVDTAAESGGVRATFDTGTATNGYAYSLHTGAASTTRGGFYLDSYSYYDVEMQIYVTTLSDGTDTFRWFMGLIPPNTPGAIGANALTLDLQGGTLKVIARSASSDTASATTTLSAATWYTLRLTYDGTTATGYVNGSSFGTVSSGLPSASGTNGYILGMQNIKSAGTNNRTVKARRGGAIFIV